MFVHVNDIVLLINISITVNNTAQVTLNFFRASRLLLIYAVLLYLTTGKKLKLNCEMAQLHYDMMIHFVDEDLATVPSHRHLMRLYKKYGIYETI